MTLRKIEEPKEEETPLETNTMVKMERFLIWVKEIALYVGKNTLTGYYQRHPMDCSESKKIKNIYDYDACILQKKDSYWPNDDPYLCIAGGLGKTENIYVKILIETIFPVYPINPDRSKPGAFWHTFYQRKLVPYGGEYFVETNVQNEISQYQFKFPWRDDMDITPIQYSREILSQSINQLRDCKAYYGYTEDWMYYIIFWNLFLVAMDDDIYNEQLATVAELAACFGFDEPMMRDWCRAVEYVFAGNKLSEDCDLECETVEGAKFFLHKEE